MRGDATPAQVRIDRHEGGYEIRRHDVFAVTLTPERLGCVPARSNEACERDSAAHVCRVETWRGRVGSEVEVFPGLGHLLKDVQGNVEVRTDPGNSSLGTRRRDSAGSRRLARQE